MSWISGLFRKRDQENDFQEELRSHLEMAVEDRMARGTDRKLAEQAARREFGNVELVKEVARDQWGWRWLENFVDDARYGARVLVKAPLFSAAAILTLAIGIGANTALFSVVNGVLLKALPYPHPEQLVTLDESKPNFDSGSISLPNFEDWRTQNTTFSMMGVHRQSSFSLTGTGPAEQVKAEFVSSEFLPMLGVKPVIGRFFLEGEDHIDANPIAVISDGFWNRKFGSAPDVLGQGLSLDGRSYTIVGVVPAAFNLRVGSFRASELYIPIGQWNNPLLPNRAAGLGIHGIGRLKPGITIEQARADLARITTQLAEEYPGTNKGIGATIFPLKERIVKEVRTLLLMLLAAVGFVLLIACVNVSNLLLARSLNRAREFAVRAALGAGQGRIIRQLLTESILMAFGGGALGLLLAFWGTKLALQHLPPGLPRASEVGLDARVLFFTMGAVLVSGIVFGLAPALRTSRPNLQETLKQSGPGSSGGHQRGRGAFVAAEMAMALVLLIAAGLSIRSLHALWSVHPGFDPHNVLTFGLSLSPSMKDASPDRVRATLREIENKLATTPGVKAVSYSWGAVPLASDDEDLFWLEGQPKPAAVHDMSWALSYVIEQDFLKVMGIPLKRGRFFTAQDNEHAQHVIVIDEIFARKFFPDQDPLGKRIILENKGGLAEIVGIVGHVKQWGLDTDDTQSLRAQLYFPFMQLPDKAIEMSWSGQAMMVRFEGDAQAAVAAIRSRLQSMNDEQVMYEEQTMEEIVAASLAPRKFSMIVLGAFAALALGLASMGIYGVISYLVGQRTHEIGIRMALGAKPSQVLGTVLGQGLKMTAMGVAIGWCAAAGLTRLMAHLLFGVSATDPLTFVAVAAILIFVALAACYIPARRAMRVDPIVALRYE